MQGFKSKDLEKGKEGLQALGSTLEDLIVSGTDARSSLKARWRLNEQVYRNDPAIAGARLFDNLEPRALPVLSPRVNRIVNTTVGSFEGPGTWFQYIPDEPTEDGGDPLERAMQLCLERSGLSRNLRPLLTTAALCGVAIVRVRMADGGQIALDRIHPNDFVVSPTYGLDVRDAHFVGHRFYIPRWKVDARVKDGTYPLLDEDYVATSTSPDDDPSGRDPSYDRSQAQTATQKADWELVELWEGIVRLTVDDKPGMYLVTFSQKDNKVFRITKYPYSRPWYFDMRFHEEEGKWWPSTSVSQNIVGLCLLKADMMNLVAAGSMASVASPIVISGGSLGRAIKSLSLNQIYESAYPDLRVQGIPLNFNLGAMPAALQEIDAAIVAQTGISENRINAESTGSERTTATEVSAMEAAAQQNEGAYSAIVLPYVEEVPAFVQELMVRHPQRFVDYYGLPRATVLSARTKGRWQATGRTVSNSPHIVIGKLQAVLAMSASPASNYSYRRVEKAVVEQMALPMDTKKLEKSPEEVAAAAQAASIAAQAGGGDVPVDVGLAQAPGVGGAVQPSL